MNYQTQFYKEKMAGWFPKILTGINATPQVVRDSPAKFGGYMFYNPNSSVIFLQLYNAKAAGDVTVGTTTPVARFPIPATQAANIEIFAGVNGFDLGIVIAATTTPTGSTNPGSTLDGTFYWV